MPRLQSQRLRHIGVIPIARLRGIPFDLRPKHEYCFFLHDQCVHLLKEYAEKDAETVRVKFDSRITAKEFSRIAKAKDPIEALRQTGYPNEAKRVVLNQITTRMVSDCLHHIFEALRCMEKRKVVVALNLLRKPLKDSLTYLAWMLGDEDGFYNEFMTGEPERLTHSRLGNRRLEILAKAIAQTQLANMLDASILNAVLFDRQRADGLEGYFQHAVHLVTVQHLELRTAPQNFNFIFANPEDDELYRVIYGALPYALLFLSHVCAALFDRIRAMDDGARDAFYVRTTCGYVLVEGKGKTEDMLDEILSQSFSCLKCSSKFKITRYNAARIVMTESYRCPRCRRISAFPFSWLF